MAIYTLNANPAQIRDGCAMELFSAVFNDMPGKSAAIEARNADELKAAKVAHGRRVLELNATVPQRPEITSAPRDLDAVAVSASPATRHAAGCKAVPYTTLVQR